MPDKWMSCACLKIRHLFSATLIFPMTDPPNLPPKANF
jgi:hypothetical protein